MSVLSELEPKKVFHYFEELCKIPHGSYNTKAISDYCMQFAADRGLEAEQDDTNNVIIRKNGTAGYEESAPVIIQGHLDMVCEKMPEVEHDFEKDPLDLQIEDGFVTANGTTLGGDDGIAIAMALAVLDSDNIPHPPIEAVFTTEEEVGMEGARNLDFSKIKGNMVINIDSEEEGILTVGCAGGFRFDAMLPVAYEPVNGTVLSVHIHGLSGGHSGAMIHLQRGNANKLMGRLLNHIRLQQSVRLAELGGGNKDNVIPADHTAKIAVTDAEAVKALIREMEQIWKQEFGKDEPGLTVDITETAADQMMDETSTDRVIAYLDLMPDGVAAFEREIEGQVETSLNAGVVKTEAEQVVVTHLVRSSVESKKAELKERLYRLVRMLGADGIDRDEYPAWAYKADSVLRRRMVEVFKEVYGKEPQVVTIHAGLECGIFMGKRPELDCVSIGPDLFDIHSYNERMDIKSVERTYKYLLEVLKAMK